MCIKCYLCILDKCKEESFISLLDVKACLCFTGNTFQFESGRSMPLILNAYRGNAWKNK